MIHWTWISFNDFPILKFVKSLGQLLVVMGNASRITGRPELISGHLALDTVLGRASLLKVRYASIQMPRDQNTGQQRFKCWMTGSPLKLGEAIKKFQSPKP